MKTNEISVTSRGLGIHEALGKTETLGQESGLNQEEVLHLRLLAEELFGLLNGIAGDVEASYWMEIEDKNFELHMKSWIEMTSEMREKLLSASSSGENDAAKGFIGKLRDMIAVKLLPSEEGPSMLALAMMNAAWSFSDSDFTDISPEVWSMQEYISEVEVNREQNADAQEAWDELEKSIIAKVADEVRVNIQGSSVEIIIYKAF